MSNGRLGNFELVREAGAGGMGTVFEARHLASDVSVAVKFLTGAHVASASRLASFETEIRAISRLAHPRIVRVHDLGRTTEAFDDFQAGTPYFVMDWVPRSLDDLALPLSWGMVRSIILEVLDALAHVHARVIVHSDVKPSNILGVVGRLRLADFGIAHMRHVATSDTAALVTGTPHFMAPEQFVTQYGPIVPATDLYATACLAYRLLTGNYPFAGVSVVALAKQHLEDPFPTRDFTGASRDWFERMTAKNPADRYAFAAEAARDLMRIESAFHDPTRAPTERMAAVAEETIPFTTLLHDSLDLAGVQGAPPERGRDAAQTAAPMTVIADWRGYHESRRHVEHLPATGLGIAALRYPPVVGRETERDEMWRVLGDVVREGSPQAIWIDGPEGIGKTRLAEWLGERAHELGLAVVLRVDGTDGLRAAVRESLGATEEAEDYLHARLLEVARDWQAVRVRALSRWLAHSLELDQKRDRVQVVRDALRLVANGRPLIVILDSIDRIGSDAIELVDSLVHGKDPQDRLLFVATSSTEFGRLRKWTRISLGPLEDESMRWLVRDLAGLNPDLAAEVVGAAHGQPLYAMTLVAGWIERRELRAGPYGFELVSGVELERAPLDEVWRSRLDQLIRDLGPHARSAMEIAAALGSSFGADELPKVSRMVNVSVPPDFLAVCDERGLLGYRQDQVRFINEAFRELVAEQARMRNTWKSWIGGCVHALPHAPARRRAVWERELEAWGRAAKSYLCAACEAFSASEIALAGHLSVQAQRAAVRLDPRDASRLLLEVKVLRARLWGTERIDSADEVAAEVVDRARDHGWNDLLAEALELRARFARKRIDLDASRALYAEARAAFDSCGDPNGGADCDHGLGMCAIAQGLLGEAQELFDRALESKMAARDIAGAAWCANGLGDAYRKQGEYGLARSWYERALNWFESVGNTYGSMWCVHDLAQTKRFAGDLAGAEEGYVATIALARRIGIRLVAPRLNLGIARVQRGLYEEARLPFEEVLEESLVRKVDGEAGLARICLLPCDAAAGDWSRLEENLRLGAQAIGTLVDRDLGLMARRAAEIAYQAGHPSYANLAALAARHP